ncbi:MAG: hypothetical protein K8S23_14015 [Candidatus Cloacimonetes bacterium]|nr:hypothetical protein [Candidatus Cloacimonadota bacterium]
MVKNKTTLNPQKLPGFKEMKLNPFNLMFKSKNLEKLFEKDYYRKSLTQVRISFVLAIILYALFSILDSDKDMQTYFWLIRFSVVIPIGLLVIISSFSHDFNKYKDITFAFSMILFGLGINAMMILSSANDYFFYNAALMITFIFAHTFISIRFIPATLTGLIILILYEITAILFLKISFSELMANNYLFLSANIIGMFSSYSIELYARRDFYIALLLEENQEKLNEINLSLEDKVKESTKKLVETNEELTLEIDERNKIEIKIKESLFEKEVLLKEIHHRVKNNMQIISSMLYLQSEYCNDKETKKLLLDSQNRIYSMAIIHERLYQSDNLAKIDLNIYVDILTQNIFSIYNKENMVKLETDIDDIGLNLNTAVPFGLLLNELITNALKHGFKKDEGGLLKIRIHNIENDQIRLSVFNNGISFPEHIDIHQENLGSYGLELIKILTNQLEGELKLDCSAGTEFLIEFVNNV